MIIDYKIQENDYLDFQLFTASKSEVLKKTKNLSWIFLAMIPTVICIYFYKHDNIIMSIYFIILSAIFGIFYPKYFYWRHKKNYKNYIIKNYQDRFGIKESLEITSEYLVSKNKLGEGKIMINELEEISETKDHFFLKISTGLSLIIPKREINNVELLKKEFESIGLEISNELTWKWD